jgi:restriction system protein
MSRSPHELEPVEPILTFNMVDSRFVEGQPILDELDQRKNVATLSPYEFESLVRDLFQKMGHDTKQTRPSRDGGVDCVAFDTRPIVGGRVVIQAKRYRHVVGVSAVRDLYGTTQNERANKGILITTSHYTSAARQFAKELPLQLIDGAGLLSLLETEAGVHAKIDFPEGWADPTMSVSDD